MSQPLESLWHVWATVEVTFRQVPVVFQFTLSVAMEEAGGSSRRTVHSIRGCAGGVRRVAEAEVQGVHRRRLRGDRPCGDGVRFRRGDDPKRGLRHHDGVPVEKSSCHALLQRYLIVHSPCERGRRVRV